MKSRSLRHEGRLVLRSHLVWFQNYGVWPTLEIDHINCDFGDDRIENLREVTHQQNLFNRRKPRNNKSGEKNVFFDNTTKRWRVRVNAAPIKVYTYASHKLSAILAARLIRRELHGAFTNGGTCS